MLKVALCGVFALSSGMVAATAARAEGWSVTKKPANGVCLAGRDGIDPATKRKNAIVFGIYKDPEGLNLVVTLTSQDWTFTKDQPVNAELLLLGEDGNTVALRSKWVGDGQTLANTFDKARPIVTAFGASPAFTLQVAPNKGVTFDTPNAAGALASAEACLSAN